MISGYWVPDTSAAKMSSLHKLEHEARAAYDNGNYAGSLRIAEDIYTLDTVNWGPPIPETAIIGSSGQLASSGCNQLSVAKFLRDHIF